MQLFLIYTTLCRKIYIFRYIVSSAIYIFQGAVRFFTRD